jgi:Mat/Ecp fimbriae major subunit
MKTVLRTAVAGLALASFGISSAASAATATANAEADIIAALTVEVDDTNARDVLDFGTIAESGSGGTVTLAPGGTVPNCGAGLVCTGPYNTPRFIITGVVGSPVAITLTDTSIDLLGPGDPMPVALTLSAASLTLDGTDTFEVGGTLTVNAGQVVGHYEAPLEVNVVYN